MRPFYIQYFLTASNIEESAALRNREHKNTRPHSPAYAVIQDLTVLLRALREGWFLLKSLPFDAQVFRLSRQQNPQTPATVIGALGLAEIGDGNLGCGPNHKYLNFFGDSNPDREQGLILFSRALRAKATWRCMRLHSR